MKKDINRKSGSHWCGTCMIAKQLGDKRILEHYNEIKRHRKSKKLAKASKMGAKELAELEKGEDISDITNTILKKMAKKYKMSLKEVKKIVGEE